MSELHDVGAFFETFNAKYLEPEQVAASYIYSGHFEELCGPYHAVLAGPRGSGKTTLLKMLQPAALDAWKSSRAREFRRKIDYTGVFIASDISWSRQLSSLGYGRLSQFNQQTLILACFTTHVLHAIVESMVSRLGGNIQYRRSTLTIEGERELATQLLNVMRAEAPFASLLSVKQALRSRLSNIRRIANQGSLQDQTAFQASLATIDYLHLDFLDIAANITSLFNDAASEEGARWALLFDELETAPDWIVEQLFSNIRVSDKKLFLKLAISPVSAVAHKVLASNDGPAHGQDHRQIPLWYTDKIRAKNFCEAVWRSLTHKAGIKVSAREALGPSAFEPIPTGHVRDRNPYQQGEHWGRVFNSLSQKDRSFTAFLRARHIDLGAIGSSDQRTKDTVLRKAAPVAAVRNFYLHEDDSGAVTSRYRKTSALYAGVESIFAISEGNPRWLISLLMPMISYMVQNRVRRVPEHVQAQEIDNAAERMLALLRTIPIPTTRDKFDALGLHQILQTIGLKLHNDLMTKQFTIDPKLSFTVDRQVPPQIHELLSAGLNRGALMLVNTSPAQSVVGNMNGAVLRLSYLLAAKFGLPLRKGKSTNLSLLTNRSTPTVPSSQLDFMSSPNDGS